MRVFAFLALLFLPTLAAATPEEPTPYADQATSFADFADTSAGEPLQQRLAHFHAQFDPLLPGFYRRASPAAQAALDAQIASALKDFPKNRDAFARTIASFGPAFTTAQDRFRRTFPDYTLTMPVYLIQSFGQMDGGTRRIDGKPALVFGADVIVTLHDDTTIGPFLDHELFHVYHARFFPDCPAIWCSLWQEGLAVHVAARMNPGASDRQLELTYPRPIRGELGDRIPQAMCFVQRRLDSTSDRNYAEIFMGSSIRGAFPPRFGYLIGALLAERIGATLTLEELAKLPPDAVRVRLAAALATYRC